MVRFVGAFPGRVNIGPAATCRPRAPSQRQIHTKPFDRGPRWCSEAVLEAHASGRTTSNFSVAARSSKTAAPTPNARLLNHLVSAQEQRLRELDAQRLGRPEVDHQRKSCRLLDRHLFRFPAAEHPADILGATSQRSIEVGTKSRQEFEHDERTGDDGSRILAELAQALDGYDDVMRALAAELADEQFAAMLAEYKDKTR